MESAVLPRSIDSRPAGLGGIRPWITVALTVWLVLVLSLGAIGAFVVPPGTPPFPIALGVGAPLLLFFAWLRLSRSFRDFVRSLDLRLIAGTQAWRWAGLGFIFLYAYHVLPATFALPAGLGDMAVGITAPWMARALARQPGFAASSAFIRWNLLGILDLVAAVSLGTLSGLLTPSASAQISTAPMQTLPLLLVPAFLVPLFLMLHTAALMQSRQITRLRGVVS